MDQARWCLRPDSETWAESLFKAIDQNSESSIMYVLPCEDQQTLIRTIADIKVTCLERSNIFQRWEFSAMEHSNEQVMLITVNDDKHIKVGLFDLSDKTQSVIYAAFVASMQSSN